jgi:PKD repeat protein
MEPTQAYPLNYPVFEADQVLTNDDLNLLVDYLDSQQRLTRTRLIGMGIVCGLELSQDPSAASIRISRGCGVTSWGYLVLGEAVTLGFYRDYTLPSTVPAADQYPPFTLGSGQASLYELLTTEEYDNLNDRSQVTALQNAPQGFLKDKVVVLYLEITEDNLKNCLTGDCDNKGIDVAINLKRLLVSTADLSAGSSGVATTATGAVDGLADLFMPVVTLTSTAAATAAGIYKAYTDVFDTSVQGNIIDRLSDALNRIYTLLSPLLTDFPSNPFLQVKATLVKRLADVEKNVPYAVQYYYDFIDDLVKAYDELKHSSRAMIAECCPDDSLFPLHLLLGMATVATAPGAAYRQYFLCSPLYTGRQDLVSEIRQLFARIKVMIDNFFVPSPAPVATNVNLRSVLGLRGNALKVKITPSRLGTAPLSVRAIPYYYQIDRLNPIQVSWNFRKSRAGKSNQNLSYNADKYNTLPEGQPFINPLSYSLEPYNFFRIEGHIGQNYYNVLKYITTQQGAYRLPFDVVAVKLGTDWTDITPDAACVFSDLEAEYELLKSELYCKLGDQICYYASQRYASDIPLALGNLHLLTALTVKDQQKAAALAAAPGARSTAAEAAAPTPATGDDPADAQTTLADFNLAAVKIASTGLTLQDVGKYTSLLPVNLRATFLVNVYSRGQFLSGRPCFTTIQQPPSGTTSVGLAYLARLKQGAIPAYPPNDIRLLSDYLLKMTDLIEGVVSTIFYPALGTFNADDFSTSYQALTRYATSLGALLSKSANQANVPAGLAARLSAIHACCQMEKLQALKRSYQSRLQKLQQSMLFAHYLADHPGLDHKAGVPRGGTFVLVYYEKPAAAGSAAQQASIALQNTVNNPAALQTALGTISLSASTAAPAQTSGLYQQLTGIVQDKQYSFTPAQQQAILKVITQRSPAATPTDASRVQLPDKGVIADFYLPYLCCSGCGGGTTYVFPPEPTTTGDPVISITPTLFCANDTKLYPVAVTPAGGSATGDGLIAASDGSFAFTPEGLSAGSHTLSYQLDNKTATVAVTITQAPAQPDFNFKVHPTATGATVNFEASGANAGLVYHWDFGDGTTADTLAPAAHDYAFDGASTVITVTFTITDGPCEVPVSKQVSLTKSDQSPVFAITPTRFAFNDPGVYPFDISPAIDQAGIVTATTDPKLLSNPDSLPLKVSGGKLVLVPAMPKLAATLVSTLGYQSIRLTITIVRPVARFTIGVKTTARTAGTFLAAAPAAAATIQLTAVDTGADAYHWTINGRALADLVPGTVDGPAPVINAAALVSALNQVQQWTVELTLSYTINDVTATDDKKGTVTLDQLTKAVNQDPLEPSYGS